MSRLMTACAVVAAASLATFAVCTIFVAVRLAAPQVVVDDSQATALVANSYPGTTITCPKLTGTVPAGTRFTCEVSYYSEKAEHVALVVNSDGTYDIDGTT